MNATIVRMISSSGHYAVYMGSSARASRTWSVFYPQIPFQDVTVTVEDAFKV